VGTVQISSQGRRNLERGEKGSGATNSEQVRCRPRRRQVEVVEDDRTHLLERSRTALPVLKVWFGRIQLRDRRPRLPQKDEAIRIRIGQGCQDDSVNHAEHRAVRPNAESESQQGNDGEARAARKATKAVGNILEKAFSEGVP